MKTVIAGGGSGGHLFPGIAVAEELKKRDDLNEVLFMGTEHGLEARVIPELGYPIRFLHASGVLGKSVFQKAISMLKLLSATWTSLRFLRATRPDIVIGTGGYVSAAPVIAGRMLGIPTLILEQNLVPGLANRLLASIADQVAVTYYDSMSSLPGHKTHLTGNPVRASITEGRRDEAIDLFGLDPNRITVLIIGGSAGALKINESLISALTMMLDIRENIQFVHQSGEQAFDRVRKAYLNLGFKAMVAPFIKEMSQAYALADIVISRAGATSLAEITALGRPAIIVPYPHAAGHQSYNAQRLSEAGACVHIPDSELEGSLLASEIKKLYGSEEIRGEMRRAARALGRVDAASKVVDLAVSLVKQVNNDV
jgi:UDP-N-acetylglucosamine--N-acetylmuramyl-(pentapeptide) pyrophosphoryl-undecaprenol N-acetylglucosamine transferase